MGLVDDFQHERQVVATERIRILPLIAILVESRYCHIVPHSVLSVVFGALWLIYQMGG